VHLQVDLGSHRTGHADNRRKDGFVDQRREGDTIGLKCKLELPDSAISTEVNYHRLKAGGLESD
jgi:hypothetical protein